ncbi:hypothetical protein [Streptomyces sp. ODS28]|uniref:hypothetical protein n=1 Tax=Streptomyces sp. ODS28 TaxID=3136688 RepID=UPI0031EF0468
MNTSEKRGAREYPTGYLITLPPDWIRIPLRAGTGEALDALLFSRLKELPPEIPKDQGMSYRIRVRRAIEQQVKAAQDANGIDLYVPVESSRPRYGIPLAASFVVAEFSTTEEDPGPEVILARLAAADVDGAESQTLELADTLAVRRAYTRAPAPEKDMPLAARHVDYALAVPYAPRSFISVSFSTAGDGDPESEFTEAVTELFDATMMTFRWTGLEAEENVKGSHEHG